MESGKRFQTKEQLLDRLQEGIAFGDGEEYNPAEYQKMALENALQWQKDKYSHVNEHEKKSLNPVSIKNEEGTNMERRKFKKLTPESLENDYWDLVETDTEGLAVEYGNDIDTNEYWSGFPTSERGRSLGSRENCANVFDHLPEPKFGTEEFYKESWWNLNNIPSCPGSILRHVYHKPA